MVAASLRFLCPQYERGSKALALRRLESRQSKGYMYPNLIFHRVKEKDKEQVNVTV